MKNKIRTRKPTIPNRWLITMRIKKGFIIVYICLGSRDRIELLRCIAHTCIRTYRLAITKDTLQLLLNKSFDCFFVRFDDHHSIDACGYSVLAGHWCGQTNALQTFRWSYSSSSSISNNTATGGRWRQSYNLCAEKNDSLYRPTCRWFFFCIVFLPRDRCFLYFTHISGGDQ